MITDDDVEKAVDWITANARKAAQARAEYEYLEEYRRVVRGQIMREHDDKPVGKAEAIAYADPRYTSHLAALKIATEAHEYQRWMLTAAETKVSAWQTQQRAMRAGP